MKYLLILLIFVTGCSLSTSPDMNKQQLKIEAEYQKDQQHNKGRTKTCPEKESEDCK